MNEKPVNKPFGVLLKELIEKSPLTQQEFEKKMNDMLGEMHGKKKPKINSATPPVAVVKMMLQILRPTVDEFKAVFRALAPLIAADKESPFSELAATCRLAVGLSMREVGERLNRKIPSKIYEPGVRIALYEMGALFPTPEEGEALAQIYIIPPQEYGIFTGKVSKTRQKGIKLVDENFVASGAGPTDEQLEKAIEIIEQEKEDHNRFIIAAAAEILRQNKDNPDNL